MNMTKYHFSRGFTLIETMVAVTILAFAVAGPLYTANRVVVAAQTARSQLTASYLAQEGIEYVRSVRDNEYLSAYRAGGTNVSSTAWNNFLNAITTSCGTSCQFDPTNNSLTACSGSGCSALWLSSANVYTQKQTSGVATPFTRTIQAVAITANDEKITSTVSWNFHGTPYSVTINTHITPWQ
ncbi:prepilin-type N-terminal cleavage/methylation domain-containing protein [Candidatus Kaiserbacteria bacterium]|nr:prepilin-type N-terminal cleavage/methylation domain-containing protein [Candidatus Kaiserbacteria bacterium]